MEDAQSESQRANIGKNRIHPTRYTGEKLNLWNQNYIREAVIEMKKYLKIQWLR